MAASGHGPLVFTDDVTADISSKMNLHFTAQMDNDPKHTAKETQEILKANKWNILHWPRQSPDLNPT